MNKELILNREYFAFQEKEMKNKIKIVYSNCQTMKIVDITECCTNYRTIRNACESYKFEGLMSAKYEIKYYKLH